MSFTFRPAETEDLESILAIEAQSHPTAWPRSLFEGELALEWARLLVACDENDVVVGYIDYWLVHDETHILNVAVDPARRRQGLAKLLLAEAFEEAREAGALYVTLEVRQHNLGAMKLYEGLGFTEIGVRRRYYSDTGEDAHILALELNQEDGCSGLD